MSKAIFGTPSTGGKSGRYCAILALCAVSAMASDNDGSWPMFGQNPANTASTQADGIGTGTVGRLKPKWTISTAGDVSARASVVNGVVYFPDWGGAISAVSAESGRPIWSHQMSDYFPGAASGSIHSRTTPALANGMLYVGTQEGAYLVALDADTGTLRWKLQLSLMRGTSTVEDPFAIISASPVVSRGVVYTGVASIAEGGTIYWANLNGSGARGSVVAVNAATGALKWKTYTVPVGYTGGGVWGSNPVIDTGRNTIFVGTGDNYSHPAPGSESAVPGVTYAGCLSLPAHAEKDCISPNDHVDSILALDLDTGRIKWGARLVAWNQTYSRDGSDDWNVDCNFGLPQCPSAPGPDYDFGSAPNEITYRVTGKPTNGDGDDGDRDDGGATRTIIGAGQKSGIYYALDPDTGAQLWQTQVGPGSWLGGIEWGSASDGRRIYVAIANLFGIPSAGGSAGSWAALDPATGAVLWRKADPNGAIDLGPLAVANGVVYAPSAAGGATAPNMLALDAATGSTLWSFAAGGTVIAGATIVDDTVYWGAGYKRLPIPGFTSVSKFFAFSKDGR